MKLADISYIRRFLGVIEGIAVSLPSETQSILYDYMAVVDAKLDEEEKKGGD